MLTFGFFNTYEAKVPGYHEWAEAAFSKFDIFGLSEVHSHPNAEPNDRVPVPNQFEQLQHYYRSTHRGHFATSASSFQGIDYGLALFHRYNTSVYGVQSEVIHGQAGAYWQHPRIITSCNQIQSAWYDTGTEWILFAHLHGLWRKSGKHDCVERDAQSVRIIHHLERRMYEVYTQGKPVHIVLGGDFNLTRQLRALKSIEEHMLFGEGGAIVLNDTVSDGYNTRTTHYPPEKETRQADFVLVSRSLDERATLHIDREAKSDHALLGVTIST